jgi:tryptophanyl-tRNA synthetase
LDGPSSSLSDHSTFNTSTGVQSTASLPLPNIFTVQNLQQQVQREQGQSISATLNHQEAATQDQRHQQQDTDDDLATFLALESVFGVGFDEQKSGDDGANDNLSGESASASGDSWLPNPL